MASAVLASQNESSWAHMGKIPYSNPHLSDNPNPKKRRKQKQFLQASGNGVVPRPYQSADSPAVTPTGSEDAYSFNQTSTSQHAGNFGGYLNFNVASFSKSELRELRKQFSAELEQIRDLRRRIESGQLFNAGNPRSHAKSKGNSGNKKTVAAFGSVPDRVANGFENGNHPETAGFDPMLKECRSIVGKLMKHKFAYVFKAPVDAVALGLHDYHHIVKRPMDLGTVKSNLAKNLYATASEFAADARLIFNNALLYNPKHDPVHGMAQQMLLRFEELFKPIQAKIESSVRPLKEREMQEFRDDQLQGNSWKKKGSPLMKPERIGEAHSSASTPSNPPPPPPSNHPPPPEQNPSPDRAAPLPAKDQKPLRTSSAKQPKPRAKDPNKRPMSMEEKQKLGIGLQNLPQEKMPQLIQIIKKRSDQLSQDGDEIELDIEALDTETLWELDRFVTNWKKFVSKTKRQALLSDNNDATAGAAAPSTPINDANEGTTSDKNNELEQKPKEINNEEEDVDIDDDMPATNFPPVEIEKDEGAGTGGGEDPDNKSSSSSGTSSSDSSSSSDSDSGTSSGSDLDADDAQS